MMPEAQANSPATTQAPDEASRPIEASGPLGALLLGALGVVYGDIGTSPLYTLKTALEWAGGATPTVALGMFSLIVWTLIITTSVKYVALVMRADRRKIEQSLVPIRSFIDDQMVENILVALKIEVAATNGGREPSNDEIARFLRERKPASLLRTIRTHPTMRGLESLTKSDHQVLRWCAMLGRLL